MTDVNTVFDEKVDLPVTVTLTLGQWFLIYAMIGGFDGISHKVAENGVGMYIDALDTIALGIDLAWPGALDA